MQPACSQKLAASLETFVQLLNTVGGKTVGEAQEVQEAQVESVAEGMADMSVGEVHPVEMVEGDHGNAGNEVEVLVVSTRKEVGPWVAHHTVQAGVVVLHLNPLLVLSYLIPAHQTQLLPYAVDPSKDKKGAPLTAKVEGG